MLLCFFVLVVEAQFTIHNIVSIISIWKKIDSYLQGETFNFEFEANSSKNVS